jgi:hypothetical protein
MQLVQIVPEKNTLALTMGHSKQVLVKSILAQFCTLHLRLAPMETIATSTITLISAEIHALITAIVKALISMLAIFANQLMACVLLNARLIAIAKIPLQWGRMLYAPFLKQ